MRHDIFKSRKHMLWSPEEDAVLMAGYTKLGFAGLCDLLPARTLGAIKTRINTLKTCGKWFEPEADAPPAETAKAVEHAFTSIHPRDRTAVQEKAAVPVIPVLPSAVEPVNAWVQKTSVPGVDAEQKEWIRKRVIWEIQHLAGELNLPAVKVARCMQELAREDFRGPRALESVASADELPNMHQASSVGRMFRLTRPIGIP